MGERVLWNRDGTGTNQQEEEAWVNTITRGGKPGRVYAVVERDLKVVEFDAWSTVEKVVPVVIIQFDEGVDEDGKQYVFELFAH